MRTRDPGCKKFVSGIRDKHPVSVTLVALAQVRIGWAVPDGRRMDTADPDPDAMKVSLFYTVF